MPQLGCECRTCRSTDVRDKRMRSSILLKDVEGQNVLIDCGPDFYHQMLREHSPRIDALLLTHIHYDHVGGLDDMRPYCGNGPIDVYCTADVARDLRSRMPYCFAQNPYPGVPSFSLHVIEPYTPFQIGNARFTPLPVMHYKLPIVGFKTCNFAYITDCKTMPERTIDELRHIEILVLNALRNEPHLSHLSLDEALKLIGEIRPERAYLTHISHQLGLHSDVQATLPANVRLAYDGLCLDIR